jgi:aminomethyltransferase
MKTSPFDSVHRTLGANFGEYAGWSLPADFGDPAGEADAVANHCAVVDLCSFGRIQVKGPGAKEAIEAVFSEKSGKILDETWVWVKGDIGGEVICRVIRINGEIIVMTLPEQIEIVLNALKEASNGATITDITEKTAMLGLYGPVAFDSMDDVLPFDIDHLDPGDVDKMSFFMISFTLLRGSWAGGDGLELICPAAAGPMAASAVAKYRHKHNITPAGMACLKAAMEKAEKPL